MPGLDSSPSVDKTVENIGRLPPDLLAETCQQILSHLQGQVRGVDSAEISDKFQRAGIRLDQEALQEVVQFLFLTFRSTEKNNLSADVLVARLGEGSSKWSKAALQVLHRLWSDQGTLVNTHQESQAMLSIGQLVDMQWKLGMAVSSDTCRSLNSPHVSLLLKIADTSGQISQRSFEMTIAQFQNFYRQFKEMAAVLETV
ncbi:COMM domain-containing protein 6 isoform 1-T1 [Salvelinus alpinus]|uniref:COMM domain-containing protein 6 isoform X1 n=1 Tax=Salvelinus sp. IW2-2015 TaxID=2691554 RepID=UPI000CDFB86D|nr:COMM domain-containing protein 6 [Salvelinus alpinus]